ncbi:MAG: deoxyribonuclease IV [Candidatus Babeliaceae bacterium]|jgi:deoxyribonuclease-4
MVKKNRIALLGAHVSITGGLEKAFEEGALLECTALQIFTHSNRQWHLKKLSDEAIESFLQAWKNSSIETMVVHASYLLNLGSPDHALYQKSCKTLTEELERCAQLKIPYLVIHPGAATTSSRQESLIRVAEALDHACETVKTGPTILLENTAGQGTTVGTTFEELAYILHHVKHKSRVGVCFDTCHAFAAGYQFSTEKEYQALWKQFDTIIGLDYLKAIHINDSKNACNSRVDRHEHIGKGEIGLEAFKLIMNDKKFADIPKILETPKTEAYGHAENLTVLRKLIKH